MNNEKHFDECIKEALEIEMESHLLSDSERVWQRIEGTIDLFESLQLQKKPQKNSAKTPWLKIASVLAALILTGTMIGFTQVGEALPFGSVFEGLRKITRVNQILVQYRFGEETLPKTTKIQPPPPPDTEIEVMDSYQTNLTATTLDELSNIYPKVIYYPANVPYDALKEVQYLQIGDSWTIIMDFLIDRRNVLFRQNDIIGQGAVGRGYGSDTEISFHRINGVEYMVAELRYGLVNINWNKDNKLFELTCNITVDEALLLAQFIEPYQPN